MPANTYFMEIPEYPTLALTHPAYHDRARKLVHPGALLKHYWKGWVMVWPDLDQQGNEIQIVLREDRGELLWDDGDVWFPDGQTVFAEPKDSFESAAVKKARFELSRPWFLIPTDVSVWAGEQALSHPGHTKEFFTNLWSQNIHDYEGEREIAVNLVGECELRDIKLDRYFRAAYRATDTNPKAVTIDMEGPAQMVQMHNIRLVRDEALIRESGSPYRLPPALEAMLPTEHQEKLQALRDIPLTFQATLDAITDTGILKGTWPSELLPPNA